jgi:tetratricopeptide (TPR) repeat protein
MIRGAFAALILVLCQAVIAADAESGSRERTFVRALESFDHAKTPDDYRQAAAQFESLLEGGYQNGAVYYNLGNAWMRAGEYGRAIAAYRKAKPFRPRDPYLDANLRQALLLAPGRLPEAAQPWWKPVFFWSGWISYPQKFGALLASFVVGALVAAIALLLRRNRLYWVSAVAVLAGAVLSVDAALSYSDVNHSRRGVVIHETTARKGIGRQWDPAFDQPLKDGAEFTILERNGEWVLAHFEGIGDGWLPQEFIVE